jgi:pyruvate dehydrogenase E2 component (dihydrolipoamide acetyltransferase)
MVHILIMPRQGNTVESCIIGEWKVKEGDQVEAETPVCVVETDKATFEVPAGAAGTVLKILRAEGDDVPVFQPILAVGNPGEAWEAALGGAALPASVSPDRPVPPGEEKPAAQIPASAAADTAEVPAAVSGVLAVSPRARNLADKEAVDPRALSGSGPGGRVIERDVAAAAAERPPLTQAAKDELRRNMAAGLPAGTGAAGSGAGGRITLGDVRAAAAGNQGPGQSYGGESKGPAVPGEEYTDTPIKGIRRVIADNMMNSHHTTAAFTLNASAPLVNLQALRARLKNSGPELGLNNITINDLVLFAASRVLPLFPYMNAHKLDNTLRTFKPVHLGVAVSTARGLMVPVLRNAASLSLEQIARKSRELAEACRGGSVSPDDLHGSTLTVTNLGNTGIESFTPVINAPEVAILGVGGISPKAAETAPGRYEILPHLGFSLTIDHAVVDGAPAAEFLKCFCGAIRDIDLWLAK